MISNRSLSRDDRKLLSIERLFQKQEEEEKRKLLKQKKPIPPDGPYVRSFFT